MNMFTVLGASGFIGSHLVAQLHRERQGCFPIGRGDSLPDDPGHIIDCTGLTADFRTRPFETVEAHVCRLLDILRRSTFESFLYLSSTRVYGVGDGIASEEDKVQVEPLKFDDIYNISKVMGEAVCFSLDKSNVRVVRLSNVYGYDSKSENFMFTLIRDALCDSKIVLHVAPDSSKDHISVEDVVGILPRIAVSGEHRIYNAAHGVNTTVVEIADRLKELTGCSVETTTEARTVCFPVIDTSRLKQEFGFESSRLLDDLTSLVKGYKERGEVKQ